MKPILIGPPLAVAAPLDCALAADEAAGFAEPLPDAAGFAEADAAAGLAEALPADEVAGFDAAGGTEDAGALEVVTPADPPHASSSAPPSSSAAAPAETRMNPRLVTVLVSLFMRTKIPAPRISG
jgi:hypothetical protein